MIQFNLLPDVKLEYIKAQRTRRLVIGISLIVSAAAVALLVLLLSVDALQKKHLSDLSEDIKTQVSNLQKKDDISTILTVQNQLESLTSLHNSKPASDRLFGYLNSLTPASVSITSLEVDFVAHTISISGTADSLSNVNKYVDTLKLTKYNDGGEAENNKAAFSDIVLSSFSLNSANKDKSQVASYTVTLSYDETIFDNTKTVTLQVPDTTTRAQLQNPTDLFKAGEGGTR